MSQSSRNNIIIYVGGFGLPDRTASAQRARENARLFKSLGYDVVLLGKLGSGPSGKEKLTSCTIDGFDCFDIRYPDRETKYPSYVTSIDSIKSIVCRYGQDNIFAIIAYNYPPLALRLLINFARKQKIKLIAECTEWHGWEGPKIFQNLQRFALTEYRMRILARKAGNIICASQHAQSYYSDCHTVALPFVIDVTAAKWQGSARPPKSSPRRFIYAGSPGLGMNKDYIHTVVEAFVRVKQSGYNFEFVIVGITAQQFLQALPAFADKIRYLAKGINFVGRLSHEETLKQIRQSDFFVFLRPKNRVSQFGFPTKVAEAFSCGVPTITNNTSDIGQYLQTGKNGFLLQHPDIDELENAIIHALKISDSELLCLKKNCLDNNPFRYENFQEVIQDFLLKAH